MPGETPQQDPPAEQAGKRLGSDRAGEILDAAFALFAKHGYADTRIEAVARQAGVAKGTVYLYCRSKEDLFRGVVERQLAPAVAAIERMTQAPDLAPAARLGSIYNQLAEVVATGAPGEVLRLVLGESARFPELAEIYFNSIVGPALSRMQALIGEEMDQGHLRESPVRNYPMAFMAPVLTAALWRTMFQARRPLDIESFLAAYSDMAMHGLAPGEKAE